jgi:hypothetical protein
MRAISTRCLEERSAMDNLHGCLLEVHSLELQTGYVTAGKADSADNPAEAMSRSVLVDKFAVGKLVGVEGHVLVGSNLGALEDRHSLALDRKVEHQDAGLGIDYDMA